ncbi:hypothetical protein ANN_13164 [Periplaneta americana]|uniref:Uncharacterized protein n=1 Tax=Periplaneta americana TaxID=6978 RepID=A0ABQ8TJM3_PERAM|nr:hypothetical protein ANN_13164 [Periplaneta americana]
MEMERNWPPYPIASWLNSLMCHALLVSLMSRARNSVPIPLFRERAARKWAYKTSGLRDQRQPWIEEIGHQHRFSINVLTGVLGARLIGPYVLPQSFTGARYLDFLINVVPTLLEYVPCQQRLQMWFMHVGTPAHFFRNEPYYPVMSLLLLVFESLSKATYYIFSDRTANQFLFSFCTKPSVPARRDKRTLSSQFTARLSWLVLLAQSLAFTESRTSDLQRRSAAFRTQVPQLRFTTLELRASGSTVTDTTQVALWSRSWLHCYTRLSGLLSTEFKNTALLTD